MAENSKIQWTDHTFNPWRGCAHAVAPDGYVHPGCANCYAECQARRFPELLGRWGGCGESGTRVVAPDKLWDQVLTWNKRAERDGVRRHVFCASIADVWEDWGGPMIDAKGRRLWVNSRGGYWEGDDGSPGFAYERRLLTMADVRLRLFELQRRTKNLVWLFLTKRPWLVRDTISRLVGLEEWKRNCGNVWFGTSISDQPTADRWLDPLVELRGLAENLFVSAEPLLGPVNLGNWLTGECEGADAACESGNCIHNGKPLIDWVIVGGESGPKSRRCDGRWVRSLVKQCAAAGVATFVKQFGAYVVDRNDSISLDEDTGTYWPEPLDVRHNINGFREEYQGADCRLILRDRKGGDPAEWPEELRVREMPFTVSP